MLRSSQWPRAAAPTTPALPWQKDRWQNIPTALLTLRKIDATSLNRHNTALYALLLTQAQYKNDIIATSDSLINIALDYFSDGKRHIECLIYKGAVLQELG